MLIRLAPLDPLLTLVPVDFAAQQAREAAAVPDDRKTPQQLSSAAIALPVYIEELLQYNIFPASGPEWEAFLADVDRAAHESNVLRFFRTDQRPLSAALDQLSAGHGMTHISISRPGGDHHYRLDRRIWTRQDFRVGSGFVGTPEPPSALLYPFRWIGAGIVAIGALLFALLPGARRPHTWLGLSALEAGLFVVALSCFAAPLLLVGGSVQALTRTPAITASCWIAAAIVVHLFARPTRNAPEAPRALFVREGMAFLAMAPAVFVIAASMTLWNR